MANAEPVIVRSGVRTERTVPTASAAATAVVTTSAMVSASSDRATVRRASALLGLFAAHRTAGFLLARFGGRFGFTALADPASLPLLMLLLSLFSTAITPAMLALSRRHERAADRFGLDLTRDNYAAATAFVALQEENLAVPRPGRLYKIFRASHPSIGERIDFSNTYHPWRTDSTPRADAEPARESGRTK